MSKNKLTVSRGLLGAILVVLILAIAGFAIVSSSQDRTSRLESEISSSGYSWLVNYNLQNGGIF